MANNRQAGNSAFSKRAEWVSLKCTRRNGCELMRFCSQLLQKRQTGIYSIVPGVQKRNPAYDPYPLNAILIARRKKWPIELSISPPIC